MSNEIRLLIVEDNPDDVELMLCELRAAGFIVEIGLVQDAEGMGSALSRDRWDVILCDYTLPAFDAPAAIQLLQSRQLDIPLIVVTGSIGEELAASIMRQGACDFVSKSRMMRLSAAVNRAILDARSRLDQRRARAELAATNHELSTLIERCPLAICQMGSSGLVLRWNPAAERTFGLTDEAAIGRPFPDLGGKAAIRLTAMYEQLHRGESVDAIELPIMRADGSAADLVVTLALLGNGEHGSASSLMIAYDATERKRLQHMLDQAQKMESIGQLASGISHEINTPMQYIGDNARFLAAAFSDVGAALAASREAISKLPAVERGSFTAVEDRVDLPWLMEEIPVSLDHLREGIDRVIDIVCAMKAYAHPGNGDLSLCDINKAILSTMTVSRGAWKYVADIRADLQPELPLVPLALGRFNQAILNLIVNATHAIEDTLEKQEGGKGRITIATRRDGEFVFVEVSDTGCGMTDEVRRRLFEPFFTTKGVGKGTGQGLAILHAEIVDRLHGRIEVESALGVGSLFRLVIPLEAMPLPLHPDMPP